MPTTRSPDKEVLRVVKIEGTCAPPVVVPAAAPPTPAPAAMPDVPAAVTAAPEPEPVAKPPAAPVAEAPPPKPAPPPIIEFPKVVAAESARLEKSIVDTGRVDIQSIYFTVNSATIRPESDPALQAISEVLAKHGDWQMSVEGHTDSQGGDAFNLDLSKRRAAAVKVALETRFGIAASRLTTTGFGEAKPVADNATLEGRARNRRVEFVKR